MFMADPQTRNRVKGARLLRFVLFLTILACVVWVMASAPWQARLRTNLVTYFLPTARAPLWAPPPMPTFEAFQSMFQFGDPPPVKGSADALITREVIVERLIFDLLVRLLPILLITGAVARIAGLNRKDITLHLTLPAGIGLATGFLASLSIFFFANGLLPTLLLLLSIAGLLTGAALGLNSFSRSNIEPQTALNRADQASR